MEIVGTAQVTSYILKDDGIFPNNEALPLLVYQGAFSLPDENRAAEIESLFQANHWGGSWRNGVYGFHHYHSTAHEALGIFRGSAEVQFGGEQGIVLQVQRGDVVVIPAGVAHKNLGASPDFQLVGAYPFGQPWDMNYGERGERPRADQNIACVPLPQADPVYGEGGPLSGHWPSVDREGGK